MRCWIATAILCVAMGGPVLAQTTVATPVATPVKSPDKAPVKSVAKKPAAKPVEARKLFGAKHDPAPLAPRAIGFYSRGCLAGAKPLPIDGPTWQAMRLSRNRNWGHPDLVTLVERLAADAKAKDGWPGLLVGDMSQPRGGPMLTGHASHQVGLDADIWLTPMPDRRLSQKEREDLAATSMLGPDKVAVDPSVFTTAHARLIRRAASYPQVERVLVHPGIKKALCEDPTSDKAALAKIRPFWGHHYHMHIRIACPAGSEHCKPQPAVPHDDGCGKEVDDWLALLRRPPPPPRPADPKAKPPKPKPQLTLDALPPECRLVLEAGSGPAAPTAPPRPKDATARR